MWEETSHVKEVNLVCYKSYDKDVYRWLSTPTGFLFRVKIQLTGGKRRSARKLNDPR